MSPDFKMNRSNNHILLLMLLLLPVAVVFGNNNNSKSSNNNREDKAIKGFSNSTRDERLLGLFTVIHFKQFTCVSASDDSLRGTCMTKQECVEKLGKPDGVCAAGFGTCCMFTVDCGEAKAVKQNREFPSTAKPSTTCSFTFDRLHEDICQIRLDFDNLVTASPPTTGDNLGSCDAGTDSVSVLSPTGCSPPVVCGQLSGQHMYLETGTTGPAGFIIFEFGSATSTRSFRVKITYIECHSKIRAPADCVQYFTGPSGSFQSYNFQGGTMLQNQNYAVCIRQEECFCTISYSQSSSAMIDTFNLFGTDVSMVPPTSENTCPQTYVFVPTAAAEVLGGSICGGLFNPGDGMSVPGTVQAEAPYVVRVFSDDTLGGGDGGLAGFSLDYTQCACR